MENKKISEQEIVWVKDKLKYVGRLEKTIRDDIGIKGYRKLALSETSVRFLFLISIITSSVSIYFYTVNKSILSLIPLALPICSYIYYRLKVKSLEKMNVFEIITNYKIDSLDLVPVIEEFIFTNISEFENMIIWHNEQFPKYNGKINQIINNSLWQKKTNTKMLCNYVALLMRSLQKTLKSNYSLYEKAIKNGVTGELIMGDSDQIQNKSPMPTFKPLFESSGNTINKNIDAKTQGIFPAKRAPILGQPNIENQS